MQYRVNDPSLKKYRRQLRQNQTEAETKLWQHLRNKQIDGFKFFRQYSIRNYILDFYCPNKKLAIELDGGQHAERKEQDDKRTQILEQNGIEVIRFWNDQILKDTDVVLEVIWNKLHNSPNPLLP